jgi:hypothetical protein
MRSGPKNLRWAFDAKRVGQFIYMVWGCTHDLSSTLWMLESRVEA